MKCFAIASIIAIIIGIIHVEKVGSNVTSAEYTIIETMMEQEKFENLATALAHTRLLTMLQNDGPYTLLAPTDEAFAGLPEGMFETILEDEQKLTDLLARHIITGNVTEEDARKSGTTSTLQGAVIDFRLQEAGNLMVENACVTTTDIVASNGVIHVIDQVILPIRR